jgi:hypothetical protein
MAFNYKQQQTAAELASILATRLRTTTTFGVETDPVVIVGTGLAGSQSASIRVQDQRGGVDEGWDNIAGYQQAVFTTGVAQILVENTGPLPDDHAAVNAVVFASFVANDTVTIGGIVFTGKAAPASNVEFLIGATDALTAASFVTVVNAHPTVSTLVTASLYSGSNMASLVSKVWGGAGNKITLAISAHGSVSGATFMLGAGKAGGMYTLDTVVAGNTAVIAGTTLTADAAVQDDIKFVVGINDTATAANLVTTILANATLAKYVTAMSVGPRVYVSALVSGSLGNVITTTGTALRIVAANGTLGNGQGGPLASIVPQSTVNTLVCECGSRGLKVEFWSVPAGTAPVFANVASAVQYGEFDINPYWPLSGRV